MRTRIKRTVILIGILIGINSIRHGVMIYSLNNETGREIYQTIERIEPNNRNDLTSYYQSVDQIAEIQTRARQPLSAYSLYYVLNQTLVGWKEPYYMFRDIQTARAHEQLVRGGQLTNQEMVLLELLQDIHRETPESNQSAESFNKTIKKQSTPIAEWIADETNGIEYSRYKELVKELNPVSRHRLRLIDNEIARVLNGNTRTKENIE